MQTDILKNVSTRINSVVEGDELLKELQSHLRLIYDEADTLIGLWRKLEYEGIIQLRVIPAVGAERFAEYIYNKVNDFILGLTLKHKK